MRLVLSVLLSASSALGAETLVVLPLTASGGASESLAAPLTEQVLTETQRLGLNVIGASDMAAMLGLERQKQLLGCSSEGSSCLAELSGALGATRLLTGAVSMVGGLARFDLKLIDTTSNQVVRREGRVTSVENLYAAVTEVVRSVLSDLASPRPPRSVASWVATIAGGAAVAGGAALIVIGNLDYRSALAAEPVSGARIRGDALLVNVGITSALIGGATLLGGLLWGLLVNAPRTPTPSVAAVRGGAMIVMKAEF